MTHLKQLHLSATGMAFDPQTGDSFQLNTSAKFILSFLQQGLEAEEISKRMSTTYSIPYPQALSDVLEFQVQLQILGLTI